MSHRQKRRLLLRALSMTGLSAALFKGSILSSFTGLQLLSSKAHAQATTAPAPAPVAQGESLKAASKAEVQALIDAFAGDATIEEDGLSMVMDPLASNPSSIPVQAVFNEQIDDNNYCEELIFIAEGNPIPLACRFKFTALSGTTEVAFRTRLIDAQYIRALARMSDGRILSARRYVTVVAGACGI
ncbi:sulfur oxidation protein SoxY [Oligella ureolytica]|uniref:Sulfur oxidation protein SoxY n=1 Tax=Oligella ureolytica TaxID=90244 RepID=A0A378XDV0_9BURK|nr:thiosulfate oxidation carrier protein SoxY [Oligella ureolytica]QPT40605.1 sulfur oxidation protein SoxY [Oligella ureolytica]SUA51608.1 sulfur oxidation protein SoxY [Oligella ureolytica]